MIQLSLEIVLNNAHRILNKSKKSICLIMSYDSYVNFLHLIFTFLTGGIMTTYQVKTAEKAGPVHAETESVKDTGLDSLDPFWKFK